MQDPQSAIPPPQLRDPFGFAEHMVDVLADSARIYWWTWGAPGEPMIRIIDVWANLQRQHFELLREVFGAGVQPR